MSSKLFRTGTNEDADKWPAPGVSWQDAMEFCRRLTSRERAAGRLWDGYEYRLPTEAEWECCCRAGSATEYYFGDDAAYLSRYARTSAGSRCIRPDKVGDFPANAWGLFDMYGNVAEWCLDGSGPYVAGNLTDPVGPPQPAANEELLSSSRRSRSYSRRKSVTYLNAREHIVRGGSFASTAERCRSASRARASYAGTTIGFRVVLGPEASALNQPAQAAPGGAEPPAAPTSPSRSLGLRSLSPGIPGSSLTPTTLAPPTAPSSVPDRSSRSRPRRR